MSPALIKPIGLQMGSSQAISYNPATVSGGPNSAGVDCDFVVSDQAGHSGTVDVTVIPNYPKAQLLANEAQNSDSSDPNPASTSDPQGLPGHADCSASGCEEEVSVGSGTEAIDVSNSITGDNAASITINNALLYAVLRGAR